MHRETFWGDAAIHFFFINEEAGPQRLGDLPGVTVASPRASHSRSRTVSPTEQARHHLTG